MHLTPNLMGRAEEIQIKIFTMYFRKTLKNSTQDKGGREITVDLKT